MTTPFTVTVEVTGVEAQVARLIGFGETARRRIGQEVRRIGIELSNRVKALKLTGQVLHVRTGRLRASINAKYTETDESFTSTVGTRLPYGRFWELGFSGTEEVKAHARRIRQAFGRPIKMTTVQVSAHSRRVHQAARPFLVPSIVEMRTEARARLEAAIGLG